MAGSFIDDVNSGDERRALEALRGYLADTLLVAPPQAVAPLAARLQMVLAKPHAELPASLAVPVAAARTPALERAG